MRNHHFFGFRYVGALPRDIGICSRLARNGG
jgi:hypothetical protein